jgi:hypothetical protein
MSNTMTPGPTRTASSGIARILAEATATKLLDLPAPVAKLAKAVATAEARFQAAQTIQGTISEVELRAWQTAKDAYMLDQATKVEPSDFKAYTVPAPDLAAAAEVTEAYRRAFLTMQANLDTEVIAFYPVLFSAIEGAWNTVINWEANASPETTLGEAAILNAKAAEVGEALMALSRNIGAIAAEDEAEKRKHRKAQGAAGRPVSVESLRPVRVTSFNCRRWANEVGRPLGGAGGAPLRPERHHQRDLGGD